MITVLQMLGDRPKDPDFLDALEAYVAADKACEKARQAFERAERLVQQREAEMRAIYEHLTSEAAQ